MNTAALLEWLQDRIAVSDNPGTAQVLQDIHDTLTKLEAENQRLRDENLREPKPDAMLVEGSLYRRLCAIEEAARAFDHRNRQHYGCDGCVGDSPEALTLRTALESEGR